MWLHNLVVAEDISPLQPPSETDAHTQIHPNHEFVADGLTFFGATLSLKYMLCCFCEEQQGFNPQERSNRTN